MVLISQSVIMRRLLLHLATPSFSIAEVWMATMDRLPWLSFAMTGAPLCPSLVEILCLISALSLLIFQTLPVVDRPRCLADYIFETQSKQQDSAGYPKIERGILLVILEMSPLRGIKLLIGASLFSFRRAQSLATEGWQLYFPGKKQSSTWQQLSRGPETPRQNLKLECVSLVCLSNRLWAAVRTISSDMRMPLPLPMIVSITPLFPSLLTLKVMAPMRLWGTCEIPALISVRISPQNMASSMYSSTLSQQIWLFQLPIRFLLINTNKYSININLQSPKLAIKWELNQSVISTTQQFTYKAYHIHIIGTPKGQPGGRGLARKQGTSS